jgi:hypothetical protein
MSDEPTTGHNDVTPSEWRTAWEQEHEENGQLRTRIAELERSAASAREIARVAMTHTGTRCVRAEFFQTSYGIQLVVCDPGGDEIALTKRLAKLLDVGLWSIIGLQVDGEPRPVGSSS